MTNTKDNIPPNKQSEETDDNYIAEEDLPEWLRESSSSSLSEQVPKLDSKSSENGTEPALSLKTPRSYFKLLWWIFVYPQRIEGYHHINWKQVFTLSRWFVATLIWLPLFLANLLFLPLISMSVLLPWSLTGVFGDNKHPHVGFILSMFTFLVGSIATFVMLRKLPEFVGVATAGLIIVIVIMSIINVLVTPVSAGVHMYFNAYAAAGSISIPAGLFLSATIAFIFNGQQGPVKADPFLFLVVMGVIFGFGYLMVKIVGDGKSPTRSFWGGSILFGLMIFGYAIITLFSLIGGLRLFV